MKSKGELIEKQMHRFMITQVWASYQTQDQILETIKNREMADYPVNAKTVDEAKEMITTHRDLRTTGISNTDKNAIAEVLGEIIRQQQNKNQTDE